MFNTPKTKAYTENNCKSPVDCPGDDQGRVFAPWTSVNLFDYCRCSCRRRRRHRFCCGYCLVGDDVFDLLLLGYCTVWCWWLSQYPLLSCFFSLVERVLPHQRLKCSMASSPHSPIPPSSHFVLLHASVSSVDTAIPPVIRADVAAAGRQLDYGFGGLYRRHAARRARHRVPQPCVRDRWVLVAGRKRRTRCCTEVRTTCARGLERGSNLRAARREGHCGVLLL